MTIHNFSKSFSRYSLFIALISTLASCGGGGGGGGGSNRSETSVSVVGSSNATVSSAASNVDAPPISSSVAMSRSENNASTNSDANNTASSKINSSEVSIASSLSIVTGEGPVISSPSNLTSSMAPALSSKPASRSSSSQALDSVPDSFSFDPVINALLSSDITSNTITITGINTQADISITGGLYSVDGGAFTSTSGKVTNGQKILVKVTASAAPASNTKATLTVGGVTSDFTVTTVPADTTPDAFSFAAVTNAALSTEMTSNSLTISGINTEADISITGGAYSIDGGAFISTASKVTNGQKILVKVTSAATPASNTKAALAVGGVTADFTVTTVPVDTTPDAFSFNSATNIALSTDTVSNAVMINGINTQTDISITGGLYSVDGGAFTSTSSKVTNGQKIVVKAASSATPASTTKATLTVGGVSGEFTVTTVPADTAPDAFSFTAATNAALSTDITSNTATIIGINTQADIRIVGGTYSVDGGEFVSTSGKVTNGQKIVVKAASSATPASTTKATLTVGGVTGEFTVTTVPADTIPDGFQFSDKITASLATPTMSNSIVVSGINTPTPISITGGEYSIDGSTYTAASGMVKNGQKVILKVLSANTINSASQGSLTIGGVKNSFKVITVLPETTPYLMGGSLQGSSLNLGGVVSTVAGTPHGADGIGKAARFFYPAGVAVLGPYVYVADSNNNTIRRVSIATGEVTTIAGMIGRSDSTDGTGQDATFEGPSGITTDGKYLYVVEYFKVRRIDVSSGVVTSIAWGLSFANGIASDGSFLYVADTYNNTVKRISISTHAVTTLAGSGRASTVDGTGLTASFDHPFGIATDGTFVYVSDYGNVIRKIEISTAAVTTIAGTAGVRGSSDGVGAAAKFSHPQFLALNGSTLFVADASNYTIRKIDTSTGSVATVFGSANVAGTTDAVGGSARFALPYGIATDGTSLFISDLFSDTIRKADIASLAVTTLAGEAGHGIADDGIGAAASFVAPYAITTDGANLFVADINNSSVRKIIIATGEVTTLAGGSYGHSDGIGKAAQFERTTGITTDGVNLYVVDSFTQRIRKVSISSGEVTTFAGTDSITGSDDGTGTAAKFSSPSDITTDGKNLFVTDTRNCTVRKIVISTREVTTIAGRVGSCGTADGIGSEARFDNISGITTDGSNLYVLEADKQTIRKVDLVSYRVTTLPVTSLNETSFITTDGHYLYLSENGTSQIKKVDISTGDVTLLAGSSVGYANGPSTLARFNLPVGITTNGKSLFVADLVNNTIRKID